jgi:hypothetical protein
MGDTTLNAVQKVLLAMPDAAPHFALFAPDFAPTLACFLNAHANPVFW